MSKQTSQWLNTMILVGQTEKRGKAWHWRAADQGEESNHYPGAIPVGDVLRRLFHFRVIEMPFHIQRPTTTTLPNGTVVEGTEFVEVPGRKVMVADDNYQVLGVFKEGYLGHQYPDWLLGNVACILQDGQLEIGGAGLLKDRAQAYVQVEIPETLHDPTTGMAYRPNLTAFTSFDGSLKSTYKPTVGVVVCDNTLSAARRESGPSVKVRHTKHSGELQIESVQKALSIVATLVDDFSAELHQLAATTVPDAAWQKVLDALVPRGESKRAQTMADQKRDELNALYYIDERAATWKGTALGVLQAFNTWDQHCKPVRGDTVLFERTMREVITGKAEAADNLVLNTLDLVLA